MDGGTSEAAEDSQKAKCVADLAVAEAITQIWKEFGKVLNRLAVGSEEILANH